LTEHKASKGPKHALGAEMKSLNVDLANCTSKKLLAEPTSLKGVETPQKYRAAAVQNFAPSKLI
jgi:hypothetical protein